MKAVVQKGLWMLLGAFLLAGILAFTRGNAGTAAAERAAPEAGATPHYTVVETEGHNLIVTDNQANMLHFYTIDPGDKIGSELHLRGSVDLSQVGKPTIKPMNVKLPPGKEKGPERE
jgi:hypothetical protein